MDIEQVNHVARLARLKLSDTEAAELAEQLGKVLGYIRLLDEVDTEGVEPMVHAIEVRNAFRADEVRDSIAREDALQNAPATDGECFLVPDILQKG